MNNRAATMIILTRTKSTRRRIHAIEQCKNMGLNPITKNGGMVFIGKMTKREQKQFLGRMKKSLYGANDQMCFIPLCRSCEKNLTGNCIDITKLEKPFFEIVMPKFR